ncbi:hypothetical protein EMIHUDRAFT_233528 [Emiliania huxleyi CCMP1516]|uniref:Uncharacterized protein n=2 Tax=Emiliania huxleyi TaxID=2903 RepID=A0A0D3K202_EMIH1|nr:hypothetical protein EMIHUDRAFT_233528 [Emiliania huxleyi CCMP1516]EOD29787.1 hypothetical protein EMIHUDRAFT_233528 [Emiliania huxleyi CCMP1516]|eukprot:XP_005782216.1 hypothetical protein EMIHUDRAFT_233528 [Emiliania huxleyi CCMP1516]
MAAVAGDAENINKQARNGRKDWLNSSADSACQLGQEQARKNFNTNSHDTGHGTGAHWH